MIAPMAPIIFLLLATLFAQPHALPANNPAAEPTSRITVVGVVYCDTCFANTFSKHSYFLPGADVHIQCIFKANAPKTREQMSFSVNRTTDRFGTYKLDVPEVDGVDCVEGLSIESQCQATLLGSTDSACNFPGLKITTNVISVKSKQNKLCIYSLDALSYRPSKKNTTLCGNFQEELQASFNSSNFFLPYFPPYGFPWPPLPQLPPLPNLPPLPPLPPLNLPPLPPLPPLPNFPPLPPLPPLPPWPPIFPFPPLPFPSPPSLPFPFPPLPPFTPSPFLPHLPPPPAFNLGDPRTWFPHSPSLSPPSPPAFDLRDPRTWFPHFPPSSPNTTQEQKTP